jgi:deoxyribonuclease V
LPDFYQSVYNQNMKIALQHEWHVTTSEAREIQKVLAADICRTGKTTVPRLIAGVDISFNRWSKMGTAAVVVLNFPALEVVEIKTVTDKVLFPYVPGLLSFREAPLVLSACKELGNEPDMLMVDGQGVAHPRRLGLAAHLGLCLDVPTIGCAKSRLYGCHDEPGNERGEYTELLDGEEIIGAVVRTRTGVKPVYVSIGHKIDLATSISIVLRCCRVYRLPEPTRLAHQAAGGNLRLKGAFTQSMC